MHQSLIIKKETHVYTTPFAHVSLCDVKASVILLFRVFLTFYHTISFIIGWYRK